MPIDGILFTALSRELDTLLANGRIQGVLQPKPDEIVLQVRRPGSTMRLVICVHPQMARVHLTQSSDENPLMPPAFCLFLRKHLLPGRILGVSQPSLERCLTLRIEGYGPEGDRVERHLIVEIMGRHSNVILVDAKSGLIMDALKRIPRDVNSYREVLANRPYVGPPPQEKALPDDITFEEFDVLIRHLPASTQVAKGMQRAIMGMSPLAAREIVARGDLPIETRRSDLSFADIERLWRAFKEMMSALRDGETVPTAVEGDDGSEFWCFPLHTLQGHSTQFGSVQTLLDHVFTERIRARVLEQGVRRLNSAITGHLERISRKIQLQEASVAKGRRAEEYKRNADLLIANLYQLQDFSGDVQTVRLPDYYTDGEPVDIPLDPQLSPSENAQTYYKRYQKARKTVEKAGEQLRASLREQGYLESVQVALASSQTVESLREIELELIRGGYIESPKSDRATQRRSKREGAPAASLPLRYASSDGFSISVGRNNRQNDELTLRTAKPDDLWFHTKEIPGAHVLVRTDGKDVPDTTILEAAKLAAYHSKGRMSSNVPVDYTECKYVRKPKGAKPGMVIYDRQKTLFVTPHEDEISRLENDENSMERGNFTNAEG